MYRSVTVPVFREGIKFLQIPYGQKKVVLFFPFVRNSEWKFPKNIRVPFAHSYQFQVINESVVTSKCFAVQNGGRKF